MTVAEQASSRLKDWGIAEVDGPPTRTVENGEAYVTLCSGGLKDEGAPLPGLFDTPEKATESYLYHFNIFVWNAIDDAEGATLIWRERPNVDGEDGMYYVYSRLVICEE